MRWPFRKKVASNKEEARRFYNAKDYEKAEPFLDAMLKENPNDTWALDVLSRLYLNTTRHDTAVEVLQRLISLNPQPEFLRRIIHAGCVSDQRQLVMRFANKVDWKPGDEEILSKIHDKFRFHDECKAFFSETPWPSDLSFPPFVQAQQMFDSGNIQQAISLLTSLVSKKVVNESTLMYSRQVCESLGQVKMAHDLWVNYLLQIEGELSPKRSLAKRLRHAGRFEESLQIAKIVLEESPKDEQMLSLITEIAYQTETPEEALVAFHKLDSMGKAKLFHVRRYANAAIKAASTGDMLLAVQRLVSLNVDAKATIRKSYLKLHDLGAIIEAEQILDLIQGTPLQTDLKAAKALEEGAAEAALTLLDQGLIEHPEHISFLMRKGIALESLGRLEEAIALFDKVIEINPGHQSACQQRLKCGIKIWPESVYFDEITDATMQFPTDLNHQFDRLNYVLSVLKDYDLALKIVQTCLKHHPDNQRTQLYHALVRSWRNEHMGAQNIIERCLIRWPSSNDVFITASQIEKNAGNSNQQIAHINSMLNIHGLEPIASSSPTLAITPEYLSTQTDHQVVDDRLISIVMTTYKRDPLLDAAISSILGQTYQNLELIIVDDFSPDDNFMYLQKIAETDSRLRVFQMKENGGTYLAKNFGMTQAKGAFIGFMDSDDYCHSQRIECQVASLDAHPDVMGVTHDYFRIDETSDVEFRGIGALRMACISLLIRRKVVDDIGYFDSLRVGADTEYIERIEAFYGKACRLRLRIPSMFMMLHSSSLTGGGPFHISWRSVSGYRLQHHRSFRAWHKKVKAGFESPYVPRNLHIRPFDVPNEMKSIHYEWKEGMPLFSEMIKKRNHDWWKGKKSVWQKKLSPKLAGREYVEGLGIKVPDLYWQGDRIADIPEFDKLPPNFVLKPEKGWSSNNVYCMRNGVDILTHKPHTRTSVVDQLMDDEFVANNRPKLMIEELLEPEEKQAEDGLPRDFKFYCFGGRIAMIHVALRKSEVKKDKNKHQYYTPNFKVINQRIMKNRPQETIPVDKPDCWDEMVQSVQKIGESLGIYMRIDMFPTKKGAVFGEFTPTPHGGNGYSEFADQYLGSFWRGEEGVT